MMKTILLVDDEYLVRELLKRSIDFKTHHFQIVAEAADGTEALAYLRQQRVDVVFVDLCMPLMDGITLSKEIKKLDSTIEIIILTGHGDLEMARKSIHIGVSDFLLKPIKISEVEDALKKINKDADNHPEITSQLIRRVVSWVEENLSRHDLTLQLAADTFYVNNSYLSRKFKKEMGDTFKNHLNHLRMQKTIHLLETTEMKNYEIAEAVGIDNPNYLCHCFKKVTQMSIREYRNQYLGQKN